MKAYLEFFAQHHPLYRDGISETRQPKGEAGTSALAPHQPWLVDLEETPRTSSRANGTSP